MNSTSLLCSFTTLAQLDATVASIVHAYTVAFDAIYVLETPEDEGICCTYNIFTDKPIHETLPMSTISLHRKKQSNTLYTINALNALIADLNGGTIDPHFMVPWAEYRNTILVTTNNKLKKIDTRLHSIIKLSER